MAPKMAVVQQASTVEKSKSIYKAFCTCEHVAGRHYAETCAPIRRHLRALEIKAEKEERMAQQGERKAQQDVRKAQHDERRAGQQVLEDKWATRRTEEKSLKAKQQKFKAEQGDKPLFKFSMDEWKELQKVKKLLRQIQDIEALQRQGKKLDCLQLAKLERRGSLENCLVMEKERLGCALPHFHHADKLADVEEEASTVASDAGGPCDH